MKFAPALLLAPALFAADFYVSPRGADSNPGTQPRPFATLARARDAVRAANPASGATVWLASGHYPVASTIEFTAADSGSSAHPVVYRASPGATPCLTGGRPVLRFRRHKDAILVADLRAQGITSFGSLQRRGHGITATAALELFFRGRPMPLAGWPNRGWAHISATSTPKAPDHFVCDTDRPARWLNAPDAWLHGYWTFDWSDSYERIAAIDPAARTIRTQPPHHSYGYKPGQRWRVLNLLEELDEPGEWYLDRAAGRLYFWPPAPIRPGDAVVSVLDSPLLALRDAAHIQFHGLAFEHTRSDAVTITRGSDVLLSHCRLLNLGTRAVVIQGGGHHGVEDSEIAFTGDGAIELSGGDRRTLTPARHFARRNHIHHFGRWSRTYTAAVLLAGVGHLVSGNTIHHSPHLAILLHGNDHLIQRNDIHSVAMETHDVGAFYLGRDWTQRGNHVDSNYFHNIGQGNVNAIYLDDFTSGVLVTGNVVERSLRGVLIGGGHDNIIRANRFVSCDIAVTFDSRGLTWARSWFDGRDNTLFDALKAVPFQDEPWRSRYPELLTITTGNPAFPKGNRLEANFVHACPTWVKYIDGVTPADIVQLDNQLTAGPTAVLPEWVAGMGAGLHAPVLEARFAEESPTEVRLTLTNRGRVSASGAYDLWCDPDATVSPAAVSYALEPGQSRTTTLRIPSRRPLRLGAQPRGETFNPAAILLK